MRALVTGGAGFIGSHLIEVLVEEGWDVTILDNLSSGRLSNLTSRAMSKTKILTGDCTKSIDVRDALATGVDVIFHFAANPEVRIELNDAGNCYYQNVFGTYVLIQEIMKIGVEQFVFASSSAVYGDANEIPTTESYSPLNPISPYGLSKLIAEELVSLACRFLECKALVLRFANIVGGRSQRGVVTDLVSKLTKGDGELQILGDGTQTKSYLHVNDCVRAIMLAVKSQREKVEILNVGSDDQISVTELAKAVIEENGLSGVSFVYVGGVEGGRGWEGDVRNMFLDTRKLVKLGWTARLNSEEAVRLATRELLKGNT
jgi:UDP-glucose 4-epimerase